MNWNVDTFWEFLLWILLCWAVFSLTAAVVFEKFGYWFERGRQKAIKRHINEES